MKTIPLALANHKAQNATTLTDLLKIGPLLDGTFRGLTLLDQPVTYAGLTYHARTGMQMSGISGSSDLGVDNAEVTTLQPIAAFPLEGITQAQIDSGALDKAAFIVLRVNFMDLTQGAETVHSGTIGEMRTRVGGLSILELRGLSDQLKQTLCELDSLNCRARFGSQVGEERFPCTYSLAAEWIAGTATTVTEADRVFGSGLAQAVDYFAPGVVRWLTGANTGTEQEVEGFASGGVTLLYPTPALIVTGDTFQIRRDCTRKASGNNSCRTFFGTSWTTKFRGEPHIPVGDSASLLSPGASASFGGDQGTGE